jgi:hypothetical protein
MVTGNPSLSTNLLNNSSHHKVLNMKNSSATRGAATLSTALLTIAALSLTGCTKRSSASDSTVAKSSTAEPKEAGANVAVGDSEATELAGVKVQPGTATDKFVGARTDISDLSCKPDGSGVWNVEGSVKNTSKKDVDYRIYTSFLNGTETLGLIETDVENVKADATKKWSGSMTIDAEKVDCVLRVERTPH